MPTPNNKPSGAACVRRVSQRRSRLRKSDAAGIVELARIAQALVRVFDRKGINVAVAARRPPEALASQAPYDKPLRVERLADLAGKSPSSFHQHFRAVTSLSPLQFQKQLRLREARRLLLSQGTSASAAAYAVGYESVSQFTLEYGRMFGLPPARDAAEARRQATMAA